MLNTNPSLDPFLVEACSVHSTSSDVMLSSECPDLPLSGTRRLSHYDVTADNACPHSPTACTYESGALSRPLDDYSYTHLVHDYSYTHRLNAEAAAAEYLPASVPDQEAAALTLPVTAANVEPPFTPATHNVIEVEFNQNNELITINLMTPEGAIRCSHTEHTNNLALERPRLIISGLAACAISRTQNKRAKFNEIRSWIVDNFGFYREPDNETKMTNSLRSTLSELIVFEQIEDVDHMYNDWTLKIDEDAFRQIFVKKKVLGLYKQKPSTKKHISAPYRSLQGNPRGLPAEVEKPVTQSSFDSIQNQIITVRFSRDKEFLHINLVNQNKKTLESFSTATNNSSSIKPDLTTSGMAVCAICSHKTRVISFIEMRQWIVNNFKYYNNFENVKKLTRTLRPYLSANKVFENIKVPRCNRGYWKITNEAVAFNKIIKSVAGMRMKLNREIDRARTPGPLIEKTPLAQILKEEDDDDLTYTAKRPKPCLAKTWK